MWKILLALTLCCGPVVAQVDPLPPAPGPQIAELQVGVFCAMQAMDQLPAPGTQSGWIHVPDGEIAFHWPDRQIVPASLGLAFGVKARLKAGAMIPDAEMRVFRPGSATPETWATAFSDLEASVAFFRFDHPHELIPGPWRFEAWHGPVQLYAVEFEVVPAAAVPDVTDACGAVS